MITEFTISGPTNFKNISISVDNQKITLQKQLKHLGFHWKTHASKLISSIDDSHIAHRVAEFWAATKTLISSGIRFLHPHSIATLYRSTIVPKLTYGLELCNMSQTVYNNLEQQARSSLKSLFNLSKHCRNFLEPALELKHLKDIIHQQKLSFLSRLLQNDITRRIICQQFCNSIIPATFIADIITICNDRNFNLTEIIFFNKLPTIQSKYDICAEDCSQVTKIKTYFSHWYINENRINFREIMEARIKNKNKKTTDI